jgi:hypothetical protein
MSKSTKRFLLVAIAQCGLIKFSSLRGRAKIELCKTPKMALMLPYLALIVPFEAQTRTVKKRRFL